MAGLTFKVHTDGIENIQKELFENATKTEHTLAVQVASDTDPYVPMRTGNLKNSAKETIKNSPHSNMIVYPGPYARYLYYGKVMVFKDPPILRPRKKDGKMVRSHYGQTKYPIDVPLKILPNKTSIYAQSHWFDASKAANLDKWLEVAAKAVTRFGK